MFEPKILPKFHCPISSNSLTRFRTNVSKKKGRKSKVSYVDTISLLPDEKVVLDESAYLCYLCYADALEAAIEKTLNDIDHSLDKLIENFSELYYFNTLVRDYVHPNANIDHIKFIFEKSFIY